MFASATALTPNSLENEVEDSLNRKLHSICLVFLGV